MTKQTTRPPLLPWQIEAAANANRLMGEHKKRTKMTKEKFAEEHHLGSPGNLGHYLNARQPINLTAAIKLAKGMNCTVGDIHNEFAIQLEKGGINPGAKTEGNALEEGSHDQQAASVENELSPKTKEAADLIASLPETEMEKLLDYLRARIKSEGIGAPPPTPDIEVSLRKLGKPKNTKITKSK